MTQRNWRNFWCELLVSLLVVSLPAHAQKFEKECDPNDAEKCSQPLVVGEVAPFSGQLLTPKLAIDLGQKAASFDERLELKMKYVKKMSQLDLDLEKKLHEIDNEACTEKVDLLTDRLKTATLEHWYQHPIFVASLSVFLTAGVFIGGAYLFTAMSE